MSHPTSSFSTLSYTELERARLQLFSDAALVEQLSTEVTAYMLANGFTYQLPASSNDNHSTSHTATYTHAPSTLLPTPIPRHAYERCKSLATDFNLLVDAVARHPTFLTNALKDVIQADKPFTGKLFSVYQRIQQQQQQQAPQSIQPYMLGIHRSDYMFHESGDSKGISDASTTVPQQVEINCISSSFGCLSTKATQLHQYVTGRYYQQMLPHLPPHDTTSAIARALSEAVHAYAKQQGLQAPATSAQSHSHHRPNQQPPANGSHSTSPSLAVLFIVQPDERNTTDQRLIEYALWHQHQIPVIRRTFLQIHEQAQYTDSKHGKQMTIKDETHSTTTTYTIAVAYYRAGYTPRDYTSEIEWDTLLDIELSNAIKCPTTAYHLAGTKKVQQIVSQREDLLIELVGAERAKRLQSVFAGLWGLDQGEMASETQKIIQEFIAHPDNYVLKPQREGGGNNLWGDEAIKVLKTASPDELQQYIVMRKIDAKPQKAALMKQGQVAVVDVISELGIFSSFLHDGSTSSEPLLNEYVGHLLRTKSVDSHEGGVAAGFAVIDSPVLYG